MPRIQVLCLAPLVGWLVGCGGLGASPDNETILTQTPVEQVGRMLQTYREGLKPPPRGDKSLPVYKPGPVPPPRGLKDLMPMAKGYPQAVNALRDHAVLLFWKTDLTQNSDAGSVVLAYAREVPEQGGQVLMQDGSIRKMTATEFQAARKPAGASTEDQAAPLPHRVQ